MDKTNGYITIADTNDRKRCHIFYSESKANISDPVNGDYEIPLPKSLEITINGNNPNLIIGEEYNARYELDEPIAKDFPQIADCQFICCLNSPDYACLQSSGVPRACN